MEYIKLAWVQFNIKHFITIECDDQMAINSDGKDKDEDFVTLIGLILRANSKNDGN